MEFYNPVKLIFGSRVRQKIVEECHEKSVLIFCTSSAFERYKRDSDLIALFTNEKVLFEHAFKSNPSLSDIVKISQKYKNSHIDLIIGFGGGSSMDVAKIASVSIPAHREGMHINNLLNDSGLFSLVNEIDCIQVPTTAGTGSEVTSFATVWDYDEQKKKSLSHPSMFAKKAFIDPDFLSTVPVEIAVSTGLDALNQAFESIWNLNSNELTRPLARKAAELALQYLPEIDKVFINPQIRENLALASLFAGLAISQTRTSICHSISYPLTLKYGVHHGLACAFSMLEVYQYNLSYIKDDIEIISFNLKQDPYILLSDIFTQHKINSYLARDLPNISKFFESVEDFVTTGRFENNIRECNRMDLINIITDSYDKAVS